MQKYMDLYEDVEFPYPDTFNDNYATRLRCRITQRDEYRQNMTLVYDLKVDELKDKEAYKEWNIWWLGGTTGSYDPGTTGLGSLLISLMWKIRAETWKGEDLVKWKYQRYIKDYVRCIKSIDDGGAFDRLSGKRRAYG